VLIASVIVILQETALDLYKVISRRQIRLVNLVALIYWVKQISQKKLRSSLTDASKEVGLEVNAEKAK
jgi:hypothetical protein